MRSHQTGHWSLLLIIPWLAGAIGCQPAAPTSGEPALASGDAPMSVIVEEQIEFGPGSLDLPDMRVGLAEASSYESRLTITFDGTRAGQPLNWSGTYAFAAADEPLARQLTIETAGDGAAPPLLLLEQDGVAYEKAGEDACLADVIDPSNSEVEQLEPAAQLPSLFGADEAGNEAVNGVSADHFTFDERALAEAGSNKTTGELWLAVEDGHVLRYTQSTTGDASYFGEATEGSLTYEYELTSLNQPVTIVRPADCLPGLVDAPLLPDAANVGSLPGLLTYETAASLDDVLAFYQQQLPSLGWTAPSGASGLPEGMSAEEYQQALEILRGLGPPLPPTPTPNPNETNQLFERGGQTLIVTLTRVGSVTQVQITLGNTGP